MRDPLFGKYCYIDTPWIAGEKTIYKIVRSGVRSNGWREVPVKGRGEVVVHDWSEDVVYVVLDTLIDETSKIEKFALKDVELIDEPNCSEKPNNSLDKDTNVRCKPNDCKYAVNPSGDVWECGCCLEIFCEHQIYDRNPDGTLNIVECGFEPKTEPLDKDTNVRSKELQTDGYMTAEQTEDYRKMLDKAVYDKWGNIFDARADIEDEPQTDCAWGKGEDHE